MVKKIFFLSIRFYNFSIIHLLLALFLGILLVAILNDIFLKLHFLIEWSCLRKYKCIWLFYPERLLNSFISLYIL